MAMSDYIGAWLTLWGLVGLGFAGGLVIGLYSRREQKRTKLCEIDGEAGKFIAAAMIAAAELLAEKREANHD